MDEIRDLAPHLDTASLARRRDHLMHEITLTTESRTNPADRPRRRWPWIAGGAVLAAGLAGGGIAAAGGPAIWRDDDGTAAIDAAQLRGVYEGHYVTQDEIAALSRQDKATAGAVTGELACQGIYLLFDTQDEVDAYMTDFALRYPAQGTLQPDEDPCARYVDAPRYVHDESD